MTDETGRRGPMRLDGVGRRYGVRGPWVLRDVHLDLPRRSLVRIEGRNGSGKSTLLRLVAGIDAPSRGRITGRPRTAYVPERFPAALPFTAVGYLTHLGRVHGLRGPEAARRATDWLERFGAAAHARTPLAELSKGTSQKVAVTQALLAGPELLVLDEAWTGLDPAARDVLDRAVAERVAEGGTVVFVDHDPRRLAGAADARYRVTGDRLDRVPAGAGTEADPAGDAAPPTGPQVVIEAEAPDGTGHHGTPPGLAGRTPPGLAGRTPPGLADGTVPGLAELPGNPHIATSPDGTTARLTVPATHSDALLRALLGARPPWHIRTVAPAPPTPSTPPQPSAAGPTPDENRYP
ncbi:ATP-binding cassette domain-containing protein [Streptomyces sp. NPDC059788]|uniref:ATP-binding cassette domain-containing protein n=1 Tax=Streptomyces sp. NPDC059788 TaxID=3346948 RepID=UPI00365E776A